jgi:hypothetical protein
MKTFTCACGARLFFENSTCLVCSRELGFLPDRLTLSALEPRGDGRYQPTNGQGDYEKCQNYVEQGVCNWMIPTGEPQALCPACRLNNVIPNLDNADSRALWAEVEKAKRRLIYSLSRLGLPLVPKSEDSRTGLAFDIRAPDGGERVLTGHAEGLITLNLLEADPVAREKMRIAMKERYRTLLGHFRHEVGHYYWERLIRDAGNLERFRELFGDERANYADALQCYYGNAEAAQFADSYISSYAMAHPWEDWAETFAHYLHIVDTLDTAQHFGFTPDVQPGAPLADSADFDLLMRAWVDLTVALNALNRSMGLADAYPFGISGKVRDKLEFVHRRVSDSAHRGAGTESR